VSYSEAYARAEEISLLVLLEDQEQELREEQEQELMLMY
jgi:hypothetical protein